MKCYLILGRLRNHSIAQCTLHLCNVTRSKRIESRLDDESRENEENMWRRKEQNKEGSSSRRVAEILSFITLFNIGY